MFFCLLAPLILTPPGIAALCFGCDTVLFCPPLGAFHKWDTLPAWFCWFAQLFVDFVTVLLFFFFFFFVSHGQVGYVVDMFLVKTINLHWVLHVDKLQTGLFYAVPVSGFPSDSICLLQWSSI